MREIEFRGFSIEDDKWIYGSLVNNAFITSATGIPQCYIFDNEMSPDYDCWEDIAEWMEFLKVVPESVGQYTGLKDINEKGIFEGDIIEYSDCFNDLFQVIEYDIIKGYQFPKAYTMDGYKQPWEAEIEVIGNIYENPELLENA